MNKVMTKAGYEQVAAELDDLKRNKRHEIADKIRIARGFGDLSENSEYDAAKNEQASIEARIADLQKQMQDVQLIDDSEIPTHEVTLGATVTLHDMAFDEEICYRLVSDLESRHAIDDTIADSSPVGRAILGAKIGDVINVHLPNGAVDGYKVLAIR